MAARNQPVAAAPSDPAAAGEHRAPPQVRITRFFEAPRKLVFNAWSDPALLVRWYAPHGCTLIVRAFDFRPGGAYHHCIQTPDGHACWCKGVYQEIVAPERIVLTMAVSDEQGRDLEPAEVGMDPEWPRETVLTVAFAERDGGTELTLDQTVGEALARRTGAYPSWLQMLDRLAAML